MEVSSFIVVVLRLLLLLFRVEVLDVEEEQVRTDVKVIVEGKKKKQQLCREAQRRVK